MCGSYKSLSLGNGLRSVAVLQISARDTAVAVTPPPAVFHRHRQRLDQLRDGLMQVLGEGWFHERRIP